MANSELAYLGGICSAGMVSYFWMLRCILELRRLPGNGLQCFEETSTMLVLFLVVKAVLLVLHTLMLLFGWNDSSTGWYIGIGVLLADASVIAVAVYLRSWIARRKAALQVEAQKLEKDKRSTALEQLPRLQYAELQTKAEVSERMPPNAAASLMTLQDQCIVCLSNFEPDCTVLQLPCGHVFHEDCIADWFLDAKHDPCPFRCQQTAAADGLVFPNEQVFPNQVHDLDLEAAVESLTSETLADEASPVHPVHQSL
ncbi:Rnf103 [Symbiodinium microadriaticum]|nr:Rnf103 [Symbiodinium microadriaticum]CAE7946962.1 Rnf103 [Symbiodinium sp. KB8]